MSTKFVPVEERAGQGVDAFTRVMQEQATLGGGAAKQADASERLKQLTHEVHELLVEPQGPSTPQQG